ncbi:hypothetical protein [Candidatus Neptunichlamydia sp. REUL1]|uniref:hypothetical protein n=1 Tax=Candidatus Neptunichlamydia sp. REUL1 TaxID=3064277 RepID=UPI00293087F8|nr:hypothetical protein [Candidatus Neptunochlamydia sp. REUL1]
MKNPKQSESFNRLEESTNSYETKNIDPNTFEIKIAVPMKFKNVWLVKLDELKTSLKEVDYWNT